MVAVFFGRESAKSNAHVKKTLLAAFTDDPANCVVKLEDVDCEVEVDVMDEEGKSVRKERRRKIAAVGNWKVHPTFVKEKEVVVPVRQGVDQNGDGGGSGSGKYAGEERVYLETKQQRMDAEDIVVNGYSKVHRETVKEPHLYCFILFADVEYQRMGAGRMIMQWGNDVADALMLPCFIEASEYGEGLYRKMGYEDVQRYSWTNESFKDAGFLVMKRPAMVKGMEGKGLNRLSSTE